MQTKLYIGNTMVLRVEGVQFDGETEYVNDATVTATVKDSGDHEVEGQTWPLTLDYETDSDGNYEGIISSALEVRENKTYDIELTVTKDGNVGFWKESVKAVYRTFDGTCCS